MDTMTISIGALLSALGLFALLLKTKIESARAMGALEQRVIGLEARAKRTDEIITKFSEDLTDIKASLARLEGLMRRDTPRPRS